MTADGRSAVVLGTISLDLVAETPGSSTARAAVGNSAANIAVRLASLGWRVQMVSLVGRDHAAALVRQDLRRWGVHTDGIVGRAGYRTPRVFQVAGSAGGGADSLLLACPRCDRPRGHRLLVPTPDELPEAVWRDVEGADVVVADVAGDTAGRLFRQCTGMRWYEASLREATESEIAATVAHADVVKCSEEEADHYRAALSDQLSHVRTRILSRGGQGVDFSTRQADGAWTTWDNVPPALDRSPVDTIGAGDALTAATIDALQRPHEGSAAAAVQDALAAGQRAAARACLHPGARGDMAHSTGTDVWLGEAPFECGLCEGGL